MKILLIGPRFNQRNPLLIGGAITLFENLINRLDHHKVDYVVVDTNKKNYTNFIVAYISIIVQILFKQKGCSDISLHSSRDYVILGVIVVAIGRWLKKRTSLRKFGGEALQVYQKSYGIKRKIIDYIYSNMDRLFFEIQHTVSYFKHINPKTFWFPNVRNKVLEPVLPRTYQKRFVFMSSVKVEKGIDEIIAASEKLGGDYTIDIYGPIEDVKYSQSYFDEKPLSYKGVVKSNQVLETLSQYDVLLLPTYYKGEGYPGIIIEAYSLGIPTISTTLQGIKEIVNPYETGILIEPKDVDELVATIEYFNPENYQFMSQKAYQKFDDFNADIQTKLFLKRLTDV